MGGRESGIWGGREDTTSVLEGGGDAVGLCSVVVLFFGDEDLGAAAGFGRLVRIALVRHWHSLELFGDEGAQEAGAAGEHYAF